MLDTPRPGVDRRNLLNTLGQVHTRAFNLRSGGGPNAYGWLLSYRERTDEAVRMLGSQINSADLDRLVLTKGYERLLAGIGNMNGTQIEVQRVVNSMVSTELSQRVAAFEEASSGTAGRQAHQADGRRAKAAEMMPEDEQPIWKLRRDEQPSR